MPHTFNSVSKGAAFDTAESLKENDEPYCEKVEFDGKALVVCVIAEA